jgi:hypothetical protein
MENRRDFIEKYLKERELSHGNFYKNIRDFIDASREHYRRLMILNRVANYIGFDRTVDDPKVWKSVMREVARVVKSDESTLSRWRNGVVDIPVEENLIKYLDNSECPSADLGSKYLDKNAALRFAIPRTLTYIRVFPWRKIPQNSIVPKVSSRSWKIIKSHKFHKNKNNLNQYILDKILTIIPELEVDVREIGSLKRRIENDSSQDDPMYWPFLIFKYATISVDLLDSGEQTYAWIWNEEYKPLIWEYK